MTTQPTPREERDRLKAKAEAAQEEGRTARGRLAQAMFHDAANPATVLGLLAELERLEAEAARLKWIVDELNAAEPCLADQVAAEKAAALAAQPGGKP